MKKLFLAILLLGLASTVHATSIPEAMEPKEGGPNLWLESVYVTTTATALDVGDVVCSDMDSSTGDDDNWVEQCSAADTYLAVGVVWPAAIAAGGAGTIVIRGPVATDAVAGQLTAVNGLACTSTTGGSARSCTTDAANFGIVTQVNSGTSAVVCVHCNN